MQRWLPSSVTEYSHMNSSYSRMVLRQHPKDDFDLCTSYGYVIDAQRVDRKTLRATLQIYNISRDFQGFHNAPVEFVLKSSLVELAVCVKEANVRLEELTCSAYVSVVLEAAAPIGTLTLDYIVKGSVIGKLFAHPSHRCIHSIEYVNRLTGAYDIRGGALVAINQDDSTIFAPGQTTPPPQKDEWELRVINSRIVAFIPLQDGTLSFGGEVHGLLPTIGKALQHDTYFKDLLELHHHVNKSHTRLTVPGNVLMVRSAPLALRTLFGRVVESELPAGTKLLSPAIIEPCGTGAAQEHGLTFVFYGQSSEELKCIPIEFYSLEAFREHVPFELRNTLAQRVLDVDQMCAAFATMPQTDDLPACTYVCKGAMFNHISDKDWITTDPKKERFVGIPNPQKQQEIAQKYLFQQCEYMILSAIANSEITSDGVLLTRYFPSPIIKPLLLSRRVIKRVRAIYFLQASREFGSFFSQDDRSFLSDLHKFGINVFYLDRQAKKLFEFAQCPGSDTGMFVPRERKDEYLRSSTIGVYGSNLVEGDFESELRVLIGGLLELRKTCKHPLLNSTKPLALVTGGGPGAMAVGNRVAKQLGVLSCGMFVDFGAVAKKPGATINEQKKNPYVEAFMTYRPEKLVERQADFNLDFPIFLTGGIGTDFEYALEEVRRKTGTVPAHPLILFGTKEFWGAKITARYQANLRSGTIRGSEWLSNVPYVVSDGKQALKVLTRFFNGTLPIGPTAATNEEGVVVVDDAFMQQD